MQEITREALIQEAAARLRSGTVDRVLGWQRGIFAYDVTPAVFHSEEELKENFVWNDFCGANFSKYLVRETRKNDRKVMVFLKPCDTYSFNQLLTEHALDRDRVYVVGVPCAGMLDAGKIREAAQGISSIRLMDYGIVLQTLYDGTLTLEYKDYLAERCQNCKSKKHVVYDSLLGTDGEACANGRFEMVERLEKMTSDERYAFWQNELSRCIRCNACRDVCPACTCEKCVFDNPSSGVENKAAADSFEEKLFHIIRAFHVAGRCTDCGECSRVCPQHIPLHLLNRKFIKDIDTFYGTYQAGEMVGGRSPLVDYAVDDPEVNTVREGEENHV